MYASDFAFHSDRDVWDDDRQGRLDVRKHLVNRIRRQTDIINVIDVLIMEELFIQEAIDELKMAEGK